MFADPTGLEPNGARDPEAGPGLDDEVPPVNPFWPTKPQPEKSEARKTLEELLRGVSRLVDTICPVDPRRFNPPTVSSPRN